MTKRKRRSPRVRRERGRRRPKPDTIVIGKHRFPQRWRLFDWLVPFVEGHACIHHGHTDPDDHSLCGPTIFCCVNAANRYVDLFPQSMEAQATWELTDVEILVDWLGGTPEKVMYIVFCDPQQPAGLLAIGLNGDKLLDVLYKQVPPEAYAAKADRLS
jgi:hypothetical protein